MSYSKIKKLLVERLPKLRELKFGCHIKVGNIELRFNESEAHNMLISLNYGKNEILGNDPSHADLLKVLGDDWAMCTNGQLMKENEDGEHYDFSYWNGEQRIGYPVLPEDLHDLDLPEHKETCERLISLITK